MSSLVDMTSTGKTSSPTLRMSTRGRVLASGSIFLKLGFNIHKINGNFWFRTTVLAHKLDNCIDFHNSIGLKPRLKKNTTGTILLILVPRTDLAPGDYCAFIPTVMDREMLLSIIFVLGNAPFGSGF